MIADVGQAVATVLAALGPIVTAWLAYRLHKRDDAQIVRMKELRDENLQLGERLTALMEEGSK